MYLGESVNLALFKLCMKKNETSMKELSVTDYVEKMIAHWWKVEFPNDPVPFETKRFDEDKDFVQTV